MEGDDALVRVSQRSGWFPIQGQAGWVFEQPGVVEGVPAGRLELYDLQGSSQPKPFYDCIILPLDS